MADARDDFDGAQDLAQMRMDLADLLLTLSHDDRRAVVGPMVLRALREQAPLHLEGQGLMEHAALLRALPDDVEWETAEEVVKPAWLEVQRKVQALGGGPELGPVWEAAVEADTVLWSVWLAVGMVSLVSRAIHAIRAAGREGSKEWRAEHARCTAEAMERCHRG